MRTKTYDFRAFCQGELTRTDSNTTALTHITRIREIGVSVLVGSVIGVGSNLHTRVGQNDGREGSTVTYPHVPSHRHDRSCVHRPRLRPCDWHAPANLIPGGQYRVGLGGAAGDGR